MKVISLALGFLFFTASLSFAQYSDTLPNISVQNKGNGKIVVSWINPFKVVKQISVQRSFDSLKNFKTINSVPYPMTYNNGIVDARAITSDMFYRVYVLLDSGKYFFSPSKRPVWDTARRKITKDEFQVPVNGKPNTGKPPKPEFVPSPRVFTEKSGNLTLSLPNASAEKPYSLKFFEEDGKPIFELKKITESFLMLEKVNFRHSGWFLFELYENGVLIEKHKFLIPKETKGGGK